MSAGLGCSIRALALACAIHTQTVRSVLHARGRTCKGGGEGADFCRHGKPVDEGSLVGHQDLWLHSRHAASTEHIDRQDNDRGRRRRLYQHPHRPGSEARAHGRGRLARSRSLARSRTRPQKHAHSTHTHTSAAGRALSTVPSRPFGLAGRSTRSHRQRPLADLGRDAHECLPFPPCLRRPTPSRLSMSTQTRSLLLEITSVHVPWTILSKDLELSTRSPTTRGLNGTLDLGL